MKVFLFAVATLFITSCHFTSSKLKMIDVSNEIISPQKYIVCKAEGSIKIDGLADDEAWKNVPFTNSFIDIEGVKIPKFDTKVKMLWDEQYFYVYSTMQEPHIWGDLYQRDTVIFYNNDFEVFIDPSMDTYHYGEIEINALNTVWDLKLDKPYRVGGNADNSWNLNELVSAVKIYGTLNNPNDIDSCWNVEMAIPIDKLMKLKDSNEDHPKEGEQWKVNFSRVEWDFDVVHGCYDRKKNKGKYLPEYNWVWSNQGVINMHEPEKWGVVQFTDSTMPNDSFFMKDADFLYKQVAYALFRKTQFGDLKGLLAKSSGYTEDFIIKTGVLNVSANYVKKEGDFYFTISSPSNTYVISSDGYLNIN